MLSLLSDSLKSPEHIPPIPLWYLLGNPHTENKILNKVDDTVEQTGLGGQTEED